MSDATEIVIRGRRIAQDENGFLSLTDIWKLSGESESKSPRMWRRLPTTRGLVEALNADVRYSHVIAKTPEKTCLYTRKGRGAQTFAHVILGLAYAEYLNPELGIEVREIALRVWGGDASVLDDFNRQRGDQALDDERRVTLRDQIREHNSALQFRILHGLGARSAAQYAEFHNSGYRGLYNGEDENAIHRRKELKPDQRILDYMGFAELAANMFRASLAEGRLKNIPAADLDEACATHMRLGKRVRDLMEEEGADMPEDLPTADSISDAKRRLRDYGKGQKRVK